MMSAPKFTETLRSKPSDHFPYNNKAGCYRDGIGTGKDRSGWEWGGEGVVNSTQFDPETLFVGVVRGCGRQAWAAIANGLTFW